jgi:hypothetical protein
LPEGLDARQVENYYRGFFGKIRRDHLDFMMERWRALPSREFVLLTPEIVATLRAHIARMGRGPVAILQAPARQV